MDYREWIKVKDKVTVTSPEEKRYLQITNMDGDVNYFDQLLNNRCATARQILTCSDSMIKNKFVKYLEMIEQEIKNILVLE